MRASEIRTMSFTPCRRSRAGMGAAPSGMPGRPETDVLEDEDRALVHRQRRIVDAAMEIVVVLKDHRAAPVRE